MENNNNLIKRFLKNSNKKCNHFNNTKYTDN